MSINPVTLTAWLACILCSFHAYANHNIAVRDSIPNEEEFDDPVLSPHMSLFENGGLNINSQGQFRSSAEIIKVYLGNPEKFYLPFYLTLSASAEVLKKESDINALLVSDLMMQKGGFINFGLENESTLIGLDEDTRIDIYYLIGAKSISGPDLESQSQIQYFSFVQSLGLSFTALAWNPSNLDKQGKIWIRSYFSVSQNPEDNLVRLIDPCVKNILMSHHIECGIQLKDYLDITMSFNRFTNNKHVAVLSENIYTISAKLFVD